MTESEVLDRIRSLAATHLRITRELGPETHLARDLRLDSISLLSLVVEIENEFRICFEPEDDEGVETVADVIAAVRRRLSSAEVPDRA